METTKTNKLFLGDSSILQEITKAVYNKEPLSGPDGVITKLLKQALETALEGEIEQHLIDNKLEESCNRRNGKLTKTVQSAHGPFELATPRDRNSSFEPEIVRKRQTVITDEIDNKVLSLYALGNSYQDISSHIADIYGITISQAAIANITDKLLPMLNEWRTRPLEELYTVVFMDAMYFKVKQEGKVSTKVLYNLMGISQSGHKEILGFYSSQSEGSHFWLTVLNDLKNRGVQDILVACVDGLQGFPEAINTIFPQTEVQLCIVHQIRNSLKYVSSKDQKEFILDLKQVYKAVNKEGAEYNFLQLEQKWGKRYGIVIKSWKENWDSLTTYFKYSPEIRRLIYTTNPIEGFHRQLRKYTKTKGAFTSENALYKLVYCAIMQISKKWAPPLANWSLTISQLDIFFPGRISFNREGYGS
jgi:putative transposase